MKSKAHRSQNGRSRTCEVNTIRVVELDGNPWFVAKDVCLALGFNVKSNGEVNTTHALRNLSNNEFTTHRVSSGRGGAPKIISESGLYKIIMRSNKPEARAFQDWVTQVVLPSIRKDGGSPHDR